MLSIKTLLLATDTQQAAVGSLANQKGHAPRTGMAVAEQKYKSTAARLDFVKANF